MNKSPPQFALLGALLRATPRARVIAKSLEVEGLFKHAIEENKSADGPYHNGMHAQEVARIAFGLATMVKNSNEVSKAIFVAGLFHDFNHSLGLLPDSENIEKAQLGLLEALQSHPNELPFRRQRFIALEAIASTQYPYGPMDYAFKEPCAILRDADRLQILTLNWRTQLKGLGKEMNVSPGELLLRSKQFHANLLDSLESHAARAFKPELELLFNLRHQKL